MKAGAGHDPDAGADHSLKKGAREEHGVPKEEGAAEWPAASFRAFLEAAPDAVVIVGREGRIAMVNSLTEKMFGYRREELLGNPVEMLVPERFRHRHEADRQGYERNPRTRLMGAGQELAGRRRDGTEFPVEISLSPLKTEQVRLVISIPGFPPSC